MSKRKKKAATLAELEASIVAKMCQDPVLKTRIFRAVRLRKNHNQIVEWFLNNAEARRRLRRISTREAARLGIRLGRN